MAEQEPHEQSEEPTEPPKPPRHLPQIGEKPTAPRRKRLSRVGKWVMVTTGVLFAGGTVTVKLLQHYAPGPQLTYIAPPALESLGDFAVKKGFPKQCLESASLDPFFVAPSTDPAANSRMEYWECIYSGHADGQPAPDDVCSVRLERDTFNDPYNFGFYVTKADGSLTYLGKGSQFSDIPATPGVPAACVQENVTFP